MRVGVWSLAHMHAYGYLSALQVREDVELVGLADEEGECGERWLGWGADLDAAMIGDFVAAVGEGRPPRSTGEDGLRALEVVLAAYASAREGRAVAIDEVRAAP